MSFQWRPRGLRRFVRRLTNRSRNIDREGVRAALDGQLEHWLMTSGASNDEAATIALAAASKAIKAYWPERPSLPEIADFAGMVYATSQAEKKLSAKVFEHCVGRFAKRRVSFQGVYNNDLVAAAVIILDALSRESHVLTDRRKQFITSVLGSLARNRSPLDSLQGFYRDEASRSGAGLLVPGAPLVRCPDCAGRGVSRANAGTAFDQEKQCWVCRGSGLLRGQLVISVVDLATGAVASRNVVAGALAPLEGARRASLELGPLLKDLAATLAVDQLYERRLGRWREVDPDERRRVDLRYEIEPEMPARWEQELHAVGIAREARYAPHRVFFAGVSDQSTTDPDERLSRLMVLAHELQLDLAVNVALQDDGGLRWTVTFDVAGSPPRTGFGGHKTLAAALIATTPEKALDGIGQRSQAAPPRWYEPRPIVAGVAARDWADISAHLTPLAVRARGALGIFREGEWHFAGVRSSDLPGRFELVPAFPEPTQEEIPLIACRTCHDARPSCPRCAGRGLAPDGVVVTVTDLDRTAVHANWQHVPDELAVRPTDETGGYTASGHPLPEGGVRLDPLFSVAELARRFDVHPHFLRDPALGGSLDRELLDGVMTFSNSPLADFLHRAAMGRPAGRMLVVARPEPTPPIQALCWTAIGLGLTLSITAESGAAGRHPDAPAVTRWGATLAGGAPEGRTRIGRALSFEAAMDELYRSLDQSLRQISKSDPLATLAVPQSPPQQPLDLDGMLTGIDSLARLFPDQVIHVQVSRDRWRVTRLDAEGAVLAFGDSPFLGGAMTAVLLVPVQPVDEEELRSIIRQIVGDEPPEFAVDETDLQWRWHFAAALYGLFKALLDERLWAEPGAPTIDDIVQQAWADFASMPADAEVGRPSRDLIGTWLTGMVERPDANWYRPLMSDHFNLLVGLTFSLLRARGKAGRDDGEIVEPAVQQAVLLLDQITRFVNKVENDD